MKNNILKSKKMKNNIITSIMVVALFSFVGTLHAQKQRIDSLVIRNGSQGANKVLISDANGNATWGSAISNTVIGEIKQAIYTQANAPAGWIQLDGRLKSTLTASQQAAATSLGIGTNLPDATNTYLAQIGGTLGSISGSNLITRAHLPNTTVTTTTNGAHTHSLSHEVSANAPGAFNDNTTCVFGANRYGLIATVTALSAGDHTHTFNLNGGVTQSTFLPKTLSVNTFIYLGN
jgi:hypothetical protein